MHISLSFINTAANDYNNRMHCLFSEVVLYKYEVYYGKNFCFRNCWKFCFNLIYKIYLMILFETVVSYASNIHYTVICCKDPLI